MLYRVTPKFTNTNSSAKRYVYCKDNKEIKFGFVYPTFEVITADHKKWIRSYSSKLGVCLDDIDYLSYNFNEIQSFEPVIYFSETVSVKEKKIITEIFLKAIKESIWDLTSALHKLGWNCEECSYYIWDELCVEKYLGSENSQILLKKVNSIIDKSRDEIIKECGYVEDDSIDHFGFYYDFLEAIGWRSIDIHSQFYKDLLMNQRNFRTPMLDDDDAIYGGLTFQLANSVVDIDKEWTDEEWEGQSEDETYEFAGPFETGNPHASKGYFNRNLSLNEAYKNYEGNLLEMIRPMYSNLTSDDDERTIYEFIEQYGEHPKDLIEFMNKYEESLFET